MYNRYLSPESGDFSRIPPQSEPVPPPPGGESDGALDRLLRRLRLDGLLDRFDSSDLILVLLLLFLWRKDADDEVLLALALLLLL